MKLEDIKLGMKVIITQDRTGNGWTTLHPDVAKAFIGKVGNVRGMWIPSEKEDKRAFIIDVKVDELYEVYGTISLPLTSIEPCMPNYWSIGIDDTILFMHGDQQEVGTVLCYGVNQENGVYKKNILFVEIKKDNGDTKYTMISSDCVMSKADPNKSIHY
jgi:hypothetical protein